MFPGSTNPVRSSLSPREPGSQRARSRSREGRRRVCGGESEVWIRKLLKMPRTSPEGPPGSKNRGDSWYHRHPSSAVQE
ncbi:hypothetical protein NDU88_002102 [Pleurodeles waltl]|uniref:Uncharacterized protein n=1 Tax=Pleurodeles waltl TaxID=8319 RepID=A0AAV7P9V5_PLEWA|nr:hypothetical protein NDU88_002102 [Pleurodeles waltl]